MATVDTETTAPHVGLMQSLSNNSECDKEPIHLIASIQSGGCVLFITPLDQRVQSASMNAREVLGPIEGPVIGSKLDSLLERDTAAQISAICQFHPWPGQTRKNIRVHQGSTIFDVSIFATEGLFGLEFVFAGKEGEDSDDFQINQIVAEFIAASPNVSSLSDVSTLACQSIRKLTGFDRVMLYRFLAPSWHGEVIAEDRTITAPSFLHHRFPATDIPKPARDLYLRNRSRMIPDVDGESVRLEPQINPLTRQTIDLTDCQLRAVAPVHIEYLLNMGVKASYSVAVVVENTLWGLFACHQYSGSLFLSQSQRAATEMVANSLASIGPLLIRNQQQHQRIEFEMNLRRVFESARFSTDPLDQVFRHHRVVTDAFGAVGMAYVSDSSFDFAGLTPTQDETRELAQWVRTQMDQSDRETLAYHDLSVRDIRWKKMKTHASGILAVKVDNVERSVLLFFRPEIRRTISWGGDPRKQQANKANYRGRLNPRLSFESWLEVVEGLSDEWTSHEIEGIVFFKDLFFDVLDKRQKLIRELSASLAQERKGKGGKQ